MANYNNGQFLREGIESVLSQTYGNIELILSDDGSDDDSREIMKSYGDERIQLVLEEQNTAFRVVEKTYRLAQGKYILCISSDDMLCRDAIKTYVAWMESHQDYAACFSIPEIIGTSVKNDWFQRENGSRFYWMLQFFKRGNGLCCPGVFFRRDIWNELGGFRFQFRQTQDYELWLRLVQKYNLFVYQEKSLVKYRIHDGNISRVTMETFARQTIEKAYIYLEVIEAMDRKFFEETFSGELVYPVDAEEYSLTCEKMMALVRSDEIPMITKCFYYFKHCMEEEFVQHIEKDYHFIRKELYELTGKYNFQTDYLYGQEIQAKGEVIERQQKVINELMEKVQQLLH